MDVKEEQVQYDVQSVDSKKMVDGIWWYSVTWSDGDRTEEPRVNLEGAEEMVAEVERRRPELEAMNAKPVQGSRVARKAVPLGVAGAGAGEPSELQQAMIMMAQSVSAMVQCQAEAKAGGGSSAATDGKLASCLGCGISWVAASVSRKWGWSTSCRSGL